MLGRGLGGIVAIAVALALVCAAPGSAEVPTAPEGYGAFQLRGTHGFSILVFAIAHEGSRRAEVRLVVTRGRSEVALYEAPALERA